MTQLPGDAPDSARVASEVPATAIARRPADTFSVRLLLVRHLDGLTIKEAARKTGLDDASWSLWEKGRRPRDVLDVCRRIADALDIDRDWLVFGGPLAGPHGLPTKRTTGDTERYPTWAERPTPIRPQGRSSMRISDPRKRRPNVIGEPVAA